ncbi:sodium channel protein Nach-like [Spodoptera litura]|uniref:Sodium channel protein Nach-like n=1 Tax=Spodoptera litura TaxID=69820 RepID=A0A9J7EMZ6_SPOLT|nr:sodium channel protein Nach-like [Spodoptera litura]
MDKFWRLLRTYCLNSTIVGLKYFYIYPDRLSRCFWAVNMISVLAMSFSITYFLYNRFEEMPTRIAIENQFEPIKSLPYPAITLCTPNQITKSSLEYFKTTLIEGNKTGLETYIPLVLGFYEYIDITDQTRDKLKRFQDLLEKNRYTVPDLLSRVPQMCNRFLKRCYLERKMYNCTDLFKPILTARGYCCTFNNNYMFNHRMNSRDPNFVNRTVKATGLTNALVVVTDYEMEDSINGTLLNAGAVPVMYTDWTEFPSDDELTYIDGYGESFHIISATYTYCSDEVKSLPVRSRNCYFHDEHVLDHFTSYHNSDCDHLCYANAVIEACNCTPPYIPNTGRSHFCTLVDIPCIIDVKWNMSNWLTTENCKCLRDCESRRYHGEMSLGNFNAIPYTLKNLYDGLDLNNSTSAFHFFFSNPTYLKQKQETVMSIISLASNLGGVFGLSMGFSCISFLEILFYVYLGLKMYIRNKLAKVFLAISNHYN